MKKINHILLSTILGCSLVSCGSNSDDKNKPNSDVADKNYQNKIDKLNSKNTLYQEQIKEFKAKISSLENELKQLNNDTSTKSTIENLRNEIASYKSNINELENKISDLKSQIPQKEILNENGAKLQITKDIEFKQTKGSRGYIDQMQMYFTRDVAYSLKIFDDKNKIVYEKNTTKENAKSENDINIMNYDIASRSLKPILDFGNYSYSLDVILKDGSFKKNFKGDFTKQAKPIAQFDSRISDISLIEDKLYVSEQAKDFQSYPKIYTLDTKNLSKNKVLLDKIDEKILPKTIFDMAFYKNELYIAGQASGWGDNDSVLVKYDTKTQKTTQLSPKIPCAVDSDL